MQLDAVNSELHALRKLYGLLQSSEDGMYASSVNLDEKARLILKDLLDCATERVFMTHSKIIAAQSGVSNKPFSTQPGQPEQPEVTRKLLPPASPAISKSSPIVIQNSSKNLNFGTIITSKAEPSPTGPSHQEIVLEQSKPSISASKPETRKKRCWVCQQSSMKQLNSGASETKIVNEKTQSPNKDGNDQDQRPTDCLSHVHPVNRLVKGLEPKKVYIESLKSTERQRRKRISKIQCNASTVRSLASASSALEAGIVTPGGKLSQLACEIDKKPDDVDYISKEVDKKPEDVDYISKEVAKAIERIESRLAALQLPDEVVDSLKEKNAARQGLCVKANSIPIADTITKTDDGVITRSELSQVAESVLVGNVLSNKQVSHGLVKVKELNLVNKAPSQSRKPVSVGNKLPSQAVSQREGKARKTNEVLSQLASQMGGKKLDSLNSLTSQNDHVSRQNRNYVRGLRICPSGVGLAKGTPLPSQTGKENREQNPTTKETSRKVGTSVSSVLPQSVGSSNPIRPGRNSQAVDLGRLLNRTRTIDSTRTDNGTPRQIIMRPTLLDHKSSGITVRPTFYKDRRRSGVHRNIHEGPRNRTTLPHQQLSEGTSSSSRASFSWTTRETSTSGSENESEGYPSPRRTGSRVVGPTQRRLGHMASDGGSMESSFSRGRGSHYWDVGPPRRYRSSHRKNPRKRIGRLRRFKDKLGFIFHHHHHYHHHHGKEDDKETGHDTSLWKYMRKIFQRTNNDEVYDDWMAENVRKSVVGRKNQRGQFHALVEGLMRHARGLKKSKPSKGGIGRLGNGKQGHNKKLKWFQLFQRHRGVKLPKRGRVKVGFMSKNTRLRAAKMN
ncbi:hypothetical protein L1049_016598 [Liquidambar formosana]|uniref:Uncharacterized protein n=1 Tax=Liquidambar formosana TaxID=63359 RepID=A0AAP0RZP4_LIQFO